MNKEQFEKEKASLRKEHEDHTKQLTGKLEFDYLLGEADGMTRLKDSYDNQMKTLHKTLEDTVMYSVKLIDTQKKYSELEKQLTDTTIV